jgi:conserved hypothetical integral membrane protein
MPAELVLVLMYGLSLAGLLTSLAFFGVSGVVAFSALAGVIANIQALKTTEFVFFSHPVALGTVVFTTLFIASDILTEWKGASLARRNVILCLGLMILNTGWMVLAYAYPVAPGERNLDVQCALFRIFIPNVSLTVASLTAYVCSQYYDIWLFVALKRLLPQSLVMRSFMSTAVSGFLDQMIFSFLAWYVFTPHPLALDHIFWTYVVGTYGFRLLICATSAPVLVVARRLWHFYERSQITRV